MFEISLAGVNANGREMQRVVSGLFAEQIKPELERLFDQLSNPDEWISIDRLEIDLGRMNARSFEKEFSGAVCRKIDEKLKQTIHRVQMASTSRHTGEPEVYIETELQAGIRMMIGFLRSGQLEKREYRGRKITSLAVLMNLLLMLDPDAVAEALIPEIEDPVSRRRLILQLDDSELEHLLISVIPKKGPGSRIGDSASRAVELIRFLIQSDKKSRFSSSIPHHEFRVAAWGVLLQDDFDGLTSATLSGESGVAALLEELFSRELFTAGQSREITLRLKEIEGQLSSGRLKSIQQTAWQRGINEFLNRLEGGNMKVPARGGEQEPKSHIKGSAGKLRGLTNGKDKSQPEVKMPREREKRPGIKVFEQEGVLVQNAGLVLIYPLLPAFFDRVGLLENRKFISEEAPGRAVHLLQYAVTLREQTPEEELLLNKLLCGMEADQPVIPGIEVTENEKLETEKMMNEFVRQWSALKGSSAKSVRGTFLQREGLLRSDGGGAGWTLTVERKSPDVLLDRLPWTLSFFRLPWNRSIIRVEW